MMSDWVTLSFLLLFVLNWFWFVDDRKSGSRDSLRLVAFLVANLLPVAEVHG